MVVDRVPPTICLTLPEWRSMQGRNFVIFFLFERKGGQVIAEESFKSRGPVSLSLWW